jgi:hypothetical protein
VQEEAEEKKKKFKKEKKKKKKKQDMPPFPCVAFPDGYYCHVAVYKEM